MPVYLYAKSIILEDREVPQAYLEIKDDGTFGAILQEAPAGEIIDYSAYHLAPGLVDTHIHGYAMPPMMSWTMILRVSRPFLKDSYLVV